MNAHTPKIKFCGITQPQDAELAVSLGAWAVGMIMWPASKRYVEIEAATELAAALRRRVEIAGVFVNPTLEQLSATAEAVGLTLIQLHGQEGPAFCSEAARRTGCRVIKAVRVRSRADVQALASFHTDFNLLDSYVPGIPGGTGETFAWELANDAGRRRGKAPQAPVILSGGLRPDNVADAIRAVNPYAVDVASGIELAPGRKDHAKMRAFAEAVATTFGPEPGPPAQTDPGAGTAPFAPAQA